MEYVVPSKDLPHPFSKKTMMSDSETAVEIEGYSLTERAYRSVLKELIDNAILELCFEVHREAKLSFPIPATFTIPYELIQINGKNMKSTKSVITCYVCGLNKGPNYFTTHLYTCMVVPNESEANSRKAKAKSINFKEWDSNDEDDDDDHMKKGERNKKIVKGKSRSSLGNALSKSHHNSRQSYLDMSAGEIKAFFNQKCGVVTKRLKKLCSNSHKCSIHTDKERFSVRRDLLRDEPDNAQIDVDTVEKSDINMSFSTDENISGYPSGNLYF